MNSAVARELNIDSLKSTLASANQPSQKVDCLIGIIDYYNNRLSPNSLKYLMKADSIAKANGLQTHRGVVLMKYAIFWRRFGTRKLAFTKLSQAMQIFYSQNDSLNIAEGHRQLAETYSTINADSSKYHLDIANHLFAELKDTLGLARTYNRYSNYYYTVADIEKSIEYARHSLLLLDSVEDYNFRINNYIMLIAAERDRGNFDQARKYFPVALEYAGKTSDYSYTPSLYTNFAHVAIREKKAYEVIEYVKSCVAFCEKYDLPPRYNSYIYRFKAQAYALLNEPDSAYAALQNTVHYLDRQQEDQLNKKALEHYLQYEEEKKLAELENQRAINSYQMLALLCFLAFSIIIAIIINKRKKDIEAANKIITGQNDKLKDTIQELNELNATKDKFFSIIAHDLKNPLGSFKQIAEILSIDYDNFSEKDRKEFIWEIRVSSHNLYNLLENILTWSRSQRGVLECNAVDTNLSQIVFNTLGHLMPQSQAKKIELINKLPDHLPAFCDPNLTSTVVRNLVSNSIKYSTVGSKIEIDSIAENGSVEISVRDYGTGIDDQTLNNLFKIGSSVSQGGTSGEQGTGLGLVICKEFMEKQNGSIWAESQPGQGSIFRFSLPAQKK